MLNKLKILLNITDNDTDNILNILIELCTTEAAQIANMSYEPSMDTAIIQMVLFRYNKLGTEGMAAETYNGASFSYENDYPEAVYRLLRKRKVRFL